MTNDIHFNPKSTLEALLGFGRRLQKYGIPLFLVFIALLYGFILLRIHTLNTAQPSADAISGQVKAARVPHIDKQVVQQLQSLQDNSVSVQALFEQARSNPFQ